MNYRAFFHSYSNKAESRNLHYQAACTSKMKQF